MRQNFTVQKIDSSYNMNLKHAFAGTLYDYLYDANSKELWLEGTDEYIKQYGGFVIHSDLLKNRNYELEIIKVFHNDEVFETTIELLHKYGIKLESQIGFLVLLPKKYFSHVQLLKLVGS